MTVTDRTVDFRRRVGAPAVGVALVPADGSPTVVVCGERVRGGGDPATAGDRWHIGSCMKAMTAATVARFVERGRLDWSTPLVSLFDFAGIHPGWSAVSVADVLTHTAGVPAVPAVAELRAALTSTVPLPAQRARWAAQALGHPPGPAGEFRYSNLGYVMIGSALERLTGSPFEEVLEAELLRPLGIAGAGFGPPPELCGHRARWSALGMGFGRGPAIAPDDPSVTHPPDNPAVMSPAGRLHLRLADWAAVMRLFLDGPDRLLTAGSVARITTRPAGVATSQGMGWWIPSRDPLLSRIAYAQQGSNMRWVATAAVSRDRSRAALVICNDGRTRMLSATMRLASDLLTG